MASLGDWGALADEWIRREKRFRADHYHGAGTPGEVELTERDPRVSITAPHSLNHFRNGGVKNADRRTGSMAELLGAGLDATTLVPVGAIGEWVTWEERDDDFRTALDRLAAASEFNIDVHGMLDDYDVDVCIGLGPDPSDLEREFADALTSGLSGYVVTIDTPFGAKADFTVTSYLQKSDADVAAVQLEIAARFRDPTHRPRESAELLERLAAVVEGFRTSAGIRD